MAGGNRKGYTEGQWATTTCAKHVCVPSNTHPAAPPLVKAATADTALDRTLAGFGLAFSLPASLSSFCNLAISSVVVPGHTQVLSNKRSGQLNVADRQNALPVRHARARPHQDAGPQHGGGGNRTQQGLPHTR
jgi:hypothetical protein